MTTDPNTPEPKSKCCNAPVESAHGEDFGTPDDIVTCWNECRSCHKPCDVDYSDPGIGGRLYTEVTEEEKPTKQPDEILDAVARIARALALQAYDPLLHRDFLLILDDRNALQDEVAKLEKDLASCKQFEAKKFPEMEDDSFDAGYARAVKDLKEDLSL